MRLIAGIDERMSRRYVAALYENFAKYLVDFFRSKWIGQRFIERYVRVHRKETIAQVLAEGKGAIGLTAHIGNWELTAQILARWGYKVNAVTLSHQHKNVDQFFSYLRSVTGIRVIPVGLAVRQCYAALKRNEVVGILGDRDFSGQNGIYVNFCGRQMMAPRGPAILSLRTGAPLVPGFVIRDEKDDRYFDYYFEEPIYPQRTGDEEHDVRVLTEKIIAVIERYVRQYPRQWYMFRPFWKAEKVEIL
jgi:KDO2-lipid IV(A) lauroyltransferase